MKVLLDENLAHRLRKSLCAHEVFTVGYKGWAGLKNGDQTLTYEQNLTERTIAIVALTSVEWDILKHHVPLIVCAIDNALPGSFRVVDCGTFTRKK